jgi:hypothetical protein
VTQAAREALAQSRKDALNIASQVGVDHVLTVLKEAASALEKKLDEALAKTKGEDTFTVAHMRATLEQIETIISKLVMKGMRDAVMTSGMHAAGASASNTIQYLGEAHYAFEGMKAQPLPIDEAFMFDKAQSGARASILRRLALSGEPEGVDEESHKAKGGILSRYGINVIEHFENVMQKGVIAKRPIDEMRSELIAKSPFLQAAPRFWAERIVRTETMNADNRAGWEAMREADDQLGDMCKILSATFDDRTAADSYAVHGQIRRMDEAFETWYGLMQHPPARPNDREVVVPHRVSWPIPPYLAWKSDAEVRARWTKEKRKGSPPPRPKMTTISMREFGRPQPLAKDEREPQGPVEQTRPLGYEAMAEDQAAKTTAFEALPERVVKTPEEKALASLHAMPVPEEGLEHVIHDFPSYSQEPFDGFTAAEKQIIDEIMMGDYPSLMSEANVELDVLNLESKTVSKPAVEKAIGTGGIGGDILPEMIKKDGEYYVTMGGSDVVATSLLGKTHLKANVTDLDNPGVKAFIKAKVDEAHAKKVAEEAEKKAAEAAAKKATKIAKMKATKAANKAKKVALEEAAKAEAALKTPALPDVDVSAKAIDPENVLFNKTGGQKGSNVGGFYQGKDGVQRYVKQYADPTQAHCEAVSNAIYRALGFDAPESEVFEHNGTTYHAAKLFEGKTLADVGATAKHAEQLSKGFAADVFLMNWDVVGMSSDNVFVQPGGALARIDNGGTLLMRAKAGRKDPAFFGQLSEVNAFFGSKNPSYRDLMARAGISSEYDLREEAARGTKQILELHAKHGGWENFVSKVAPDFKGADRDKLIEVLETRTNLMREKLPEWTKPKPKPLPQVATPGKHAPPPIALNDLHKVRPTDVPTQTRNQTPDSRPLYAYREHVEREIGRAPHAARRAITTFTGSDYSDMRDAFSQGDTSSYSGRLAHAVVDAFDVVEPVPGTVYRGMGFSRSIAESYCQLDEDLPLHLGPWGGQPAFASTSRKIDRALHFAAKGEQSVLLVIEQKRGIGIETISQYDSEAEVLTHPNAHFRVTKRYRADLDGRDHIVLHLEEMEDHEVEEAFKKKGLPVPQLKRLPSTP